MNKFMLVLSLAGCGMTCGLTGTAHAEKTEIAVMMRKACPMYIRLCPDGKHTSSPSGPNCELTPCPGEDGKTDGGAPTPLPAPAPAPPQSGDNGQSSDGNQSGYADGSAPILQANPQDIPPEDDPSPPGENGEPSQSMPAMPVQNGP